MEEVHRVHAGPRRRARRNKPKLSAHRQTESLVDSYPLFRSSVGCARGGFVLKHLVYFPPPQNVSRSFRGHLLTFRNIEGAWIMLQSNQSRGVSRWGGACGRGETGAGEVRGQIKRSQGRGGARAPPANQRHLIRGAGARGLLIRMQPTGATWRPLLEPLLPVGANKKIEKFAVLAEHISTWSNVSTNPYIM